MAKQIGTLVFTNRCKLKDYQNGWLLNIGRLNIGKTVEATAYSLLRQHTSFNFSEICFAIEIECLKLQDMYPQAFKGISGSLITEQQIKSALYSISADIEQFTSGQYRKVKVLA